MKSRKVEQIVQCTSRIVFLFAVALTALFLFPVLRVSASTADTAVWNISSITNREIYYKNLGSSKKSADLNFDINSGSQVTTIYLPKNILENGGPLYVTYPPFTYNASLATAREDNYNEKIVQIPSLPELKPFIKDNLDNKYPLDAQNGGSFVIDDISNISYFHLVLEGTVSRNVIFSVESRYVRVLASTSDFDISISRTAPPRTITDSEGTVWTVPDDIENPVVIRIGTADISKVMIDGASGLCYFQNPLSDSIEYVLGAEEYIDFIAYDTYMYPAKPNLMNMEYAKELGIEPIYCTNSFQFTEFLYGSLSELEVTPLQWQFRELGTVSMEETDSSGLVNEADVTVPGGFLYFKTKEGDFYNYNGASETSYIRHALVEDYCTQTLGRFNLNARVDGYVTLSFPNLCLSPELFKPDDLVDIILQDSPARQLWSEYIKPDVVLYANGERYIVSSRGGSVQIPVNCGSNYVVLEIGLYVKDDFIANYSGSISAVYKAKLNDFKVHIREYQNQAAIDITDELRKQTEELKAQTDALTKYPDADKMDSDSEKLGGAIKDYDDVSNSIFESAGNGMGDFDITSPFEFNTGLVHAISFLSTIVADLILAMGDFSLIYTVGVCMVIAGILLGLSKFIISEPQAEKPKKANGMHKTFKGLPDHGAPKGLPDHRSKKR